MTTTEKIEKMLEDKGISKKDLAAQLGFPNSVVERLIHDPKKMSIYVWAKLLKVLDTDLMDFLDGVEEEY